MSTPQRDTRFAELDALISMGYGDTPQPRINLAAPPVFRLSLGSTCVKCGADRVKGQRCTPCFNARMREWKARKKPAPARDLLAEAMALPADAELSPEHIKVLAAAYADGFAEAVGVGA